MWPEARLRRNEDSQCLSSISPSHLEEKTNESKGYHQSGSNHVGDIG